MDDRIVPVFNELSKGDRLALKGAALGKAVTGFIRDDTEQKPWRYPFYAGYLVLVASPITFFGAGTVVLVATAALTKLELSPSFKTLNRRISDSFKADSLIEAHRPFIAEKPQSPGRFKVDAPALAKDAARQGWADTVAATRSFRTRYFG